MPAETQEHSMHLSDPESMDRIRRRVKKIELRLYDEKRACLQVGDTITFSLRTDLAQTLRVTVTALLRYPTFAALLDDFDPLYCFGRNQEELLARVRRYYSEDDEKLRTIMGSKSNPCRLCSARLSSLQGGTSSAYKQLSPPRREHASAAKKKFQHVLNEINWLLNPDAV